MPDQAVRATDRILDHLGLVVSSLALTFVALRILGLAWFDMPTAFAILQFGGVATVTVGAAVALLPVLVGVVAILMGADLFRSARQTVTRPKNAVEILDDAIHDGKPHDLVLLRAEIRRTLRAEVLRPPRFLRWGICMLIALMISPLMMVTVALLSAVCAPTAGLIASKVNVVSTLRGEGTPSDPAEALQRAEEELKRLRKSLTRIVIFFRVLLCTIVLYGVFMLIGSAVAMPSLPTEAISQRGERPITAFVLTETDTSLVILKARDRQIDRINRDRVIRREICSDLSWWSSSALRLLSPVDYPECPGRS